MKQVVGLGYQAQVGKDTLADHLVNNHRFKRLAFADALKDLAYETNPLIMGGRMENRMYLSDLVDQEGWEYAKNLYEVRRYLQNVGVAARNVLDKNVWADIVANQIFDHEDNDARFVITDVRFQNEARMIHSRLGHVIKVQRPGVKHVRKHISESELYDYPYWDGTVINDGTKEHAYAQLDKILYDLGVYEDTERTLHE